MSVPKPPDPGKLVISVFTGEKDLFPSLFEKLIPIAGELDIASAWMDFDFTDYYHREMGQPLYRRVLAFKSLIDQEALADIKRSTNEIEKEYTAGNSRRVNIDPGYLLPSRFVLATGKDFSHRIYIGKQIYADLTLMYTKGGFKTLDWTYPDYAGEEIQSFLQKVRDKYMLDRKEYKGKTHD